MGCANGSRRSGLLRRMAEAAAAVAIVVLFAGPGRAFDARVGWSSVPNAAGYRLYIRQIGQPYGAGIDVGLVPPVAGVASYVAHSLPTGITNFFAVTAYDALGREGARSNELSLLFGPTPTRTPTDVAGAATRTPTGSGSAGTRTATNPATAGTPVFTATPTPPTRRRVRFGRMRAGQGETVTVPVRISGGSGVRFITLTATFDPSVVALGAIDLSVEAGTGSISAGLAVPGTLSIAANLDQPVTERGDLFEVSFVAVGECRSRTDIVITSCLLDGGAVGCRSRNGRIRVRCR